MKKSDLRDLVGSYCRERRKERPEGGVARPAALNQPLSILDEPYSAMVRTKIECVPAGVRVLNAFEVVS